MILLEHAVQPTPQTYQHAEAALLQMTGGIEAWWSGRAATACIHALLAARLLRADVQQPQAVVPAMMCPTAAQAALIAGIEPRFADVDADSGLVTLQTIQARCTPQTIAVVVIHLLGNVVELDAIRSWCQTKRILLIEDPTQALGGRFADGTFAGSGADVAIYSLNRTKIIETGCGVLVARTPVVADALRHSASQLRLGSSVDRETRSQLMLSSRNLHHALAGLLRMGQASPQQVAQAFLAVRPAYESLYLLAGDPALDLNAAWAALPAALAHRLELAQNYAQRLQAGSWKLLTGFEQSGVCWRFSLLLRDGSQQVAFSEAVRRDGFHVSNLYWAANQFFRPQDDCPAADSFGRRVVNLWVDQTVDTDYVRRCCDSLLTHAPQ
jgi:dTDP-4-amino-4,6-dideoxygalactose transaminase